MITKTERTKLKKILRSKWIPEVVKKLEDNNIVSKKGEPYTKQYISHVFNGKNSNNPIETAIFEVYEERKEKLSKIKVKRKQILENKKA